MDVTNTLAWKVWGAGPSFPTGGAVDINRYLIQSGPLFSISIVCNLAQDTMSPLKAQAETLQKPSKIALELWLPDTQLLFYILTIYLVPSASTFLSWSYLLFGMRPTPFGCAAQCTGRKCQSYNKLHQPLQGLCCYGNVPSPIPSSKPFLCLSGFPKAAATFDDPGSDFFLCGK